MSALLQVVAPLFDGGDSKSESSEQSDPSGISTKFGSSASSESSEIAIKGNFTLNTIVSPLPDEEPRVTAVSRDLEVLF